MYRKSLRILNNLRKFAIGYKSLVFIVNLLNHTIYVSDESIGRTGSWRCGHRPRSMAAGSPKQLHSTCQREGG